MKEICTISKELFKPFFDTLKLITKSVEMHVEDGKLWLISSDTAHTTMIKLVVDCKVITPFTFKIDLDKISKMSVNDDFNLYNDDNVMIVKSGSTRYIIPIIVDDNVRTYDFKHLSYTGSIALSGDDIKKVLHVVNYVKTDKDSSESLEFKLIDNVFTIKNINNTIEHVFEGLITTGYGKSAFSIDLIEGMCIAHNQYNSYCLEVATDHPCMLTLKRDGLIANIILAPRIFDDE